MRRCDVVVATERRAYDVKTHYVRAFGVREHGQEFSEGGMMLQHINALPTAKRPRWACKTSRRAGVQRALISERKKNKTEPCLADAVSVNRTVLELQSRPVP
jgi:hypothetical protein